MLENLSPPERVFPCGIRDALLSLDEADQVILKDAIANIDVWSNKGLSRALADRGLPVGENLLRRRRAEPCNDCICR
jgi:hypothetical protein